MLLFTPFGYFLKLPFPDCLIFYEAELLPSLEFIYSESRYLGFFFNAYIVWLLLTKPLLLVYFLNMEKNPFFC